MEDTMKSKTGRPFFGKSEKLFGVSNYMGSTVIAKTYQVTIYFCWIKIASYVDDRLST